MAVLTCEKLNYRYSVGTPFETAALQDVSFSVEEGEIVGIIGHTGSGKSTLIQHLNGLIEPQSGKVYVDGADIWSKQNRKQIRRVRFQVGLCFQYPEYQIFEEDVYKEIAFGPKQMGLDSEEIRRRVAPGKGILWHCLTSFLFTFIQIITNTIVKSNSEAGANTAIAVGERKNSCLSGTSVL